MKCLFPTENQVEYCHLLQALYYRFFLILWANSDGAENGMQYYYQGITDPMEIFFVAFLDRKKIDVLMKQYTERNLVFNYAQVFVEKLNVVVNYGLQMMHVLISQIKNDDQYFYNLAKRTIHYFSTVDPQLYDNCKNVDETLFISYVLKGSYNLCLHVTDLGKLSTQLTILLFTTTQDEQAFILASLISVGSRVFGPQYFKVIEEDPVYSKKETLFIEKCGNFCNDKFEGTILMLQ